MSENFLYLTRLGIDTHQEPVLYMREDCHVCTAEGFSAQGRVKVCLGDRAIIATLSIVRGDWLSHQKAGLSEIAWHLLGAQEGDKATFSHPKAVDSMSAVRGKLYGQAFTQQDANAIISDINHGRYSDIQLTAFVTACAGNRLNKEETLFITRAMVESGQRFHWDKPQVMDKHCVGGLPGNRTTPIVVAIMTALGLTMPKTSSRAITSPAGTADMMECLTHVTLSFDHMKQVVNEQGGCLAWGGSVSLSPTDDIIIRVERALDLDSEGQMVASVISKKVAAGSTHVLIDIPVGPTAKVRSHSAAQQLAAALKHAGQGLGLVVETLISDGSQPIGNGIGPALEARDVMQVLENHPQAPQDLREKSISLATKMLHMANKGAPAECEQLARDVLADGRALKKFLAICEAQGGVKELPVARHQQTVLADRQGVVSYFNNRVLSRLASLAGAPNNAAAGLTLHVKLGDCVSVGDPLITVHSEAPGELEYAMEFYHQHAELVRIEPESV